MLRLRTSLTWVLTLPGAAAYAVEIVSLATPDQREAYGDEVRWQFVHLDEREGRAAFVAVAGYGLPRPFGAGLLLRGIWGPMSREIQAEIG